MKLNSTIKLISIFLIITLLLGISGCKTTDKEETTYYPTNTWRTSTPEEQGMDSEKLLEMLEFANSDKVMKFPGYEKAYIDSIQIIRNGYMVINANFYPNTPDDTHHIYSCSKSIMSLIVGIAIDKGYIKSVNEPVLDFFPNMTFKNMSKEKKNLSIKNLLTMTTGLDINDGNIFELYGKLSNDSNKWLQNILDLPMYINPGEERRYCNMAFYLLSAIIQETTGENVIEFTDKYLFAPLGIKNYKGYSSDAGIFFGYLGLCITPTDFVKIGYLCLNNGKWRDKQIVSKSWIQESLKTSVEGSPFSYGYQWYLDSSYPGLFIAIGDLGHNLFVYPKENLIFATTGSFANGVPRDLFNEFVMPSIKSDKEIANNPIAYEKLISLEKQIQVSTESNTAPQIIPELMKDISNKIYKLLINNKLNIGTVTFKIINKKPYLEQLFTDQIPQIYEITFDTSITNNVSNNRRLKFDALCRETFERKYMDITFTNDGFDGSCYGIPITGILVQ